MKHIKLFATTSEYNEARKNLVLPNVSLCEDNLTMVYYNPYQEHDYSQDYFTTVALEDGYMEFMLRHGESTMSYSKDGGSTWSTPSNRVTVSVTSGDTVLWKGITIPMSEYGIGELTSRAQFNVEGNVMSLLYGDNFKSQTSLSGKDYAFDGLFENNRQLVSAENLSLPATTLSEKCYHEMFSYCTSLTTAPSLPATTLAAQCYDSMFKGCTGLTTAPSVLPATALANSCYYSMFQDCGRLTTAPQLPATTLANSCYYQMFYGCSSLTTAPELSATTLTDNCYYYMFASCGSLNSITCLATNISATNCTTNWVQGVSRDGGTFTKAASMTSWEIDSFNGIPERWTVVNK